MSSHSPQLIPRCLIAFGACTLVALRAVGAEVDFNRDIRPILSDACFHCHGPDANAREAKLRLDQKEGIFRTKNDVTVVAPGHPEQSELIMRITSKDDDERMPPTEAQRRLKASEIALLRRWVEEGAKWSGHWAFEPLKGIAPPNTDDSRRGTNEIDHFVLQQLRAENLRPSPEADRERLLRRVTFDLTGLPPSLAEMDAFKDDRAPDAYARVVDRLLNSPRFGERMAADWLDIARFADTHGYEMDRPRAMWAYRDWVIAAFNRNLPYDQFATWQLAGDLLPQATREQRLATAFNRLHSQNEENGIVPEEYRVSYVNDRVTTFGTAFLGLTFECARCHDHKFDPITQRDFYSLFAFFQNIDESGQIPTTKKSNVMPAPTLKLPDATQEERLAALVQLIRDQENQVAAMRKKADSGFATWLTARPVTADVPGAVVALNFEKIEADNSVPNAADPAHPAKAVEKPKLVAGHKGQAAEFLGDNGFSLNDVPVFSRADPFSFSLWLRPAMKVLERAMVFHRSMEGIEVGNRGYELVLENGRLAFGLHRQWPGNSLKVVTRAAIAPEAWTHVVISYDGSSRAAGIQIYIDSEETDVEIVRDGLVGDITYDEKQPPLQIGYRYREVGFKDGRIDEFRVYTRALTAIEAAELAGRGELSTALDIPTPALTGVQRDRLREYFLSNFDPGTRASVAALASLRRDFTRALDQVPDVMVMDELPKPKPAFVLNRGSYDQLGEPVSADTPTFLPPFPADAPRNRIGLARWLTDPANPLMARVTVNRYWQMMFGRGLVETSDNFGTTGAPPTHPELLGWLARDFIAGGWNLKALLRKIALSATYRQASHAPAASLARDPENRLLARGPARRLTAEMLRDQALAASGLLVEKIGGPSVLPYQPAGLWEELAMDKPHYDQSHGGDLYRRSLYTFIKHTVPPPAMATLDAAERSACTVRRQSTNTPLQALAMLNDVQIIEAARFVGARMIREGGSIETQLRHAFRLITSREPRAPEMTVLHRLYADQLRIFTTDSEAAAKFSTVGEAKADAALPPQQLAAAAAVATVLFNHDEAWMRR